MGISVHVVSSNKCFWDYKSCIGEIEWDHIGHIAEGSFAQERDSIKDKRIKQFIYISNIEITIFNIKQVKALSKELDIIEKLNVINKEDLEIIKNGVKTALEKNLYLEFYYD